MPADIQRPRQPLNETRARQGRWGQHIFWIMVVSTVLAALALFGAWGFRANDLAAVEKNSGASTPAEAARYDTQQSPPRQTAPPAG